MRQSIDLPADFVESAAALAGDEHIIMSIDPGKRCGVCVLNTATGRCESQTSTLTEVAMSMVDVLSRLSTGRAVHVYAREAPYSVTNAALASGRANAGALWSLGYSAGIVDAAASRWVQKGAPRWEPQPVTWRSVLGLNTGERTRAAVNDRVLEWAESTTGRRLRSRRGAKMYDEANAVGLAYATASVLAAARRTK